MMLDYLGHTREGDRIRAATQAVLRSGKVLTRDVGGKATTGDVKDAIVGAMSRK